MKSFPCSDEAAVLLSFDSGVRVETVFALTEQEKKISTIFPVISEEKV